VNERQLGTTLAALRLWQRQTDREARHEDDIASDGGRIEPLNDDEIDELCETLNFQQAPRIVVEIWNGIIENAWGDAPCELLIIDRDEMADRELPNGEPGYVTVFDIEGNDGVAIDAAFATYG
jgi:hypothetical protein